MSKKEVLFHQLKFFPYRGHTTEGGEREESIFQPLKKEKKKKRKRVRIRIKIII